MRFHSPYSDASIPDISVGELVLGGAKPLDAVALVDAATGRTLTYGELLRSVRRTAAGLAEWASARATSSRCGAELAGVRGRVSRGRAARCDRDAGESPDTTHELSLQLVDAGRSCSSRPRRCGQGTRSDRARGPRDRAGHDRRGAGRSLARLARARRRSAAVAIDPRTWPCCRIRPGPRGCRKA